MNNNLIDQQFYEHFFNHSPTGVALVSVDGVCLKVNPTLCTMFGYSEEELMKLSYNELTYPDDRETGYHLLKCFLEGQASYEVEKRHIQKSGKVFWTSVQFSLVRDEQTGAPQYFIVNFIDISKHKTAEQKLQETVERYTSLKKYNHDAVISLDLAGNIINGNLVAERMTGYSTSELVGESLTKIIGTEHLKKILADSLNDTTIENEINEFKHKDGHNVQVLTTIAPIIINETNVGFYIIAKDMTEQKRLMIAKEAAESTNRAKSEFLAMMSHEIRTPMNGVIGMTDLLKETTNLDAEQKEYVEMIHKSGEALLSIINDILDFSKIESGRIELQEEPIEIRKCIADTFEVLAPKADAKQLKMAYTVNPDLTAPLIGDLGRLKQVLLNLVGNAIKFTARGSVTVSVTKIKEQDQTLHLEFTVKDSGIGVPLDKINGLFEPFHQLDNFMTRTYEGTGLGLAISKKLVHLMGGEIWVEPTNESGATFKFTIALKQENQMPNGSKSESDGVVGSVPKLLKILVAEDNAINQLVLKKMLENRGHQVIIAENGKEVIQTVTVESFDIIFMDVHMPFINGMEATQLIKETLPQDKWPIIIAVTANALKGDREKCLAAGMDDYISKPIKSKEIYDIMNNFF